jgi:protoporphyrinogen oxidase
MKIGILGAGIAGLSTAYFLRNTFEDIQIHEASEEVGGLARSFKWHGFDCDLAPHRLFTEDNELLKELLELVPMEQVRRQSRIFLQGKWIRDPVNAAEMVLKFFPFRSMHIVWTYLFHRKRPEDNFEALVLSKFGSGLNKMFFKPYSEKLFGIPANQISAAWGRRKLRVGGIKDMIRRNSKLYFKYFYYPKQGGYGTFCERLHQDVRQFVHLKSRLIGVTPFRDNTGYRCDFAQADGRVVHEDFDVLVSSLPVSFLAKLLGLDLSLRFRPARLTYFLLNKERATNNHWFYFADGDYLINRVAEFKNFANDGLPADKTVICCEVTQVDKYSRDRLIAELEAAGVLKKEEVLDTKVIDIKHAYPIYDVDYENQMKKVADFFAGHPNIFQVGRHAQFAHKDVDEIFDDAKQTAGRVLLRKEEMPPRIPMREPHLATTATTQNGSRDAALKAGSRE